MREAKRFRGARFACVCEIAFTSAPRPGARRDGGVWKSRGHFLG